MKKDQEMFLGKGWRRVLPSVPRLPSVMIWSFSSKVFVCLRESSKLTIDASEFTEKV
jgi:hypothetical protein